MIGLIRLVRMHVVSQVFLQNQIHSFRLPIGLRPKGRAHFELRPNFFQSARQKRLVNFGSLSELMFFYIPWCFTTLSKYNRPISCAVAVSRVGTKCAILLTLSTTTMMESNPLDSGRWVMKSIETLFQHLVGMGNGLNNPASLRNWVLFCWQVTHDFTYCSTLSRKFGQ